MKVIDLIEASFGMLRMDREDSYRRVLDTLSELSINVATEGGTHTLRFQRFGHFLLPRGKVANVSLAFSRDTLIDLLEGRVSLVEAARSEQILVKGTSESLVRFHDGLLVFLDGMTKLDKAPDLLRRFINQ